MRKIALINSFFGEFPWYFKFFIKSCTTNPTIDFIIFSDNKYNGDLPKNVKIIAFTMADFNELASKKLNIKTAVTTPYKLCDFKPAYGIIFSDYLMDYDFWGMCDLDIILGRVREFMTSDILNQYDVISTRHDFLTGWFMLFRNTKEINQLFMKSIDYVKVFTSEAHYCFDECNFKHLELEDQDVSILDIPCEIDSMEHVIQRELKQGNINVFYDLIMVDGLCGKMKWDKGILTYDSNFEILLYHLIRYKANKYSSKPIWKTIPDLFYIDKYVFRKKAALSIKGFCNYFYFNKFNLFVSRIVHLSRFFVSHIFRDTIKVSFQSGIYKNQQGQDCICIIGNKLYFHEQESVTNALVPSRFKKDIYYIKKYLSLECRYFYSKNDESPKIQLIQIDGSISNYKLKNIN
ncbi:MAG: DUF6625 family protein [Flavobacterium sp.]